MYAPAIETIKIDPEKIGAVIGKGGETIRGMQEEFEAEIDIDDDGTVRVYAPSGALVDACIARIESMTREAEVGDRFEGQGRQDDHLRRLRRAGQGHRRPAAHLERQARRAGRARSRTCSRQGDEIDVTVAEVDKERGRIGLRLSEDPAIAGKSPEELQKLGTGDPTMGGGGGGRGGRGGGGGRSGGDRGGAWRTAAAAAAAAVSASASTD